MIYVRDDIYQRTMRIFDQNKDEELKGAEIIQLQVDTIPVTSIYGLTWRQEKRKRKRNMLTKCCKKEWTNA